MGTTHAAQLADAVSLPLFHNIIDGKLFKGESTLEVVNPATEAPIARIPDVDAAALELAVVAARRAFPAWANTPYAERSTAVARFLAIIKEHEPELIRLLTTEHGRPLAASTWEMTSLTDQYAPEFLKLELKDEICESTLMGHVTKRFVPLGVVCAISPWNAPVLLSYLKVFAALLTGNAIVLKPSPYAPLTVLRVAELGMNIFPPGVFNVITGGDALGPLMTAHAGFDKITFTGSTQTGKRVLNAAAGSLKRVTLELGGNDPAIVLPDADPLKIAEGLFWSMFMLNGHACISLKRLYVHESIYAAVSAALAAYASHIKTGDGFAADTALGPVQNKPQFERIQATWKEIQDSGTDILYQGKAPEQGYFFPVTLLDNPRNDAPFVQNEIFGPIRSVLKYSNVDEAIRLANATNYGLGASVWGTDPIQLRAVANQLKAGTVWINQHATLDGEFPFSGHKESGFGAEFGLEGMKSYCNVQVLAQR